LRKSVKPFSKEGAKTRKISSKLEDLKRDEVKIGLVLK
jgi:hypothetical protein